MKKTKKIRNKVTYEENPWTDDPSGVMVPVKDFLPSPQALKKARVHVTRGRKEIVLDLADDRRLEKQAEKVGISPEALMSAIIHDYLRGKLVRPGK